MISINFVDAGPVDESKNQLPDILCVIQVLIFTVWDSISNYFCHFCSVTV